MPENTAPVGRDVGRYVNDTLRDRYFAAADVIYAMGAPARSETDVETSFGTTHVYRYGPADPAAESRTPIVLIHGAGLQLGDVVPQHPRPQPRPPRLRARHPGRRQPQHPPRTHVAARARRPVDGRDPRSDRPRPGPPRRLLLRRLARPQPGPPAARTARLGHRPRPRRSGEGRPALLRLGLREPVRHPRPEGAAPPARKVAGPAGDRRPRDAQVDPARRPRVPDPPPRTPAAGRGRAAIHPDPALRHHGQAQPARTPQAAAGTRTAPRKPAPAPRSSPRRGTARRSTTPTWSTPGCCRSWRTSTPSTLPPSTDRNSGRFPSSARERRPWSETRAFVVLRASPGVTRRGRPGGGQNSSTSRSSGYRARWGPSYGEGVIGRTPVGWRPRLSSQIRGST